MNKDENDLRILSIIYYISGGLAGVQAVWCMIMLFMRTIRYAMGSESMFGAPFARPTMASPLLNSLFIFALIGAIAICLIITGWLIARRKHFVFCLVIGAISLLLGRPGIVLGVFTIVILMRPSTRELFEANKNVSAVSSGE